MKTLDSITIQCGDVHVKVVQGISGTWYWQGENRSSSGYVSRDEAAQAALAAVIEKTEPVEEHARSQARISPDDIERMKRDGYLGAGWTR